MEVLRRRAAAAEQALRVAGDVDDAVVRGDCTVPGWPAKGVRSGGDRARISA
jgi:4'-phosphopantetheinyl transferase EntD